MAFSLLNLYIECLFVTFITLMSLLSHPLITRAKPYWELMRFHRPVGILLLLWPTWWALWLAAEGFPDWHLLVIFTLGVVLMRSAGCVINDIADRKVDPHVHRTQGRPLASGQLTVKQALGLFAGLLVIAFLLVLMTNGLTVSLSIVALLLACIYPFAKRYTYLPQVVLGAAFSMGIPMAFTAQQGEFVPLAVLVYVTNLIWTVVYDTFYGMVDREYDKKIGVKSTAILFEGSETLITGSLQLLSLFGWILIGQRFSLSWPYWLSLFIVAALFIVQQLWLQSRQTTSYFKAFNNNHWVGMVVFIGIAVHYLLKA